MNKKIISGVLVAIMIVANAYMIWRVNANTMAIASYDAGISQRTGVGKLDSFWTKYIGGSKDSTSYEDRSRAESDSQVTICILFILDIVLIGAIYCLNKNSPPPRIKQR